MATRRARAKHQRARRLRPGPGKSPEEVQRNQRERLLAAIVPVVADKGYEAARVADVLEVAGVSRNAFYKLFDNKMDCFLAALDQMVELAGPTVLSAYDRAPGSWEKRMGALFDRLAVTIVARPDIARVGWVEAYAAGPEAVKRMEKIDANVERIVRGALAQSPERRDIPRYVVRALIGGIRKIIHTRLVQGREEELPELMPALIEWLMTYETPGEALRRPRKPPAGLVVPAGEPGDVRERILAAVIELVAEKGYAALAITEIANRASVSLTTFYEEFGSKEAAFVAAIDRGWRRTVASVMPAYRGAPDWPLAVSAGLHAFFAVFTVEPALGHFGAVGAYEGGQAALERRDQGLAVAQTLLRGGYELRPQVPAIAAEGIGSSIYALMSRQVRRRGAEHLYEMAPAAAFLALAPFVGSEVAARFANAQPGGGRE